MGGAVGQDGAKEGGTGGWGWNRAAPGGVGLGGAGLGTRAGSAVILLAEPTSQKPD